MDVLAKYTPLLINSKKIPLLEIRLVCVYLQNEALVVDSSDQVYNIVNNVIIGMPELNGQGVQKFTYSVAIDDDILDYSILALTADHRLYGWGRNHSAQVFPWCRREPYLSIVGPKQLRYYLSAFSSRIEQFTDMACGLWHTMAITGDNSAVIVWGYNRYGQFGNNRLPGDRRPWRLRLRGKHRTADGSRQLHSLTISRVVCGTAHSLVLTDNGQLYGFGNNLFGQLGLMPNKNRKCPRLVLTNVARVESQNLHTLALTYDGQIYLMGSNQFGQLATRGTRYCHHPVQVPDTTTITSIPTTTSVFVDIATIGGLSMAVDTGGQYYVWGLCGPERVIPEPTPVPYKSFAKIAADLTGLTINTFDITTTTTTTVVDDPREGVSDVDGGSGSSCGRKRREPKSLIKWLSGKGYSLDDWLSDGGVLADKNNNNTKGEIAEQNGEDREDEDEDEERQGQSMRETNVCQLVGKNMYVNGNCFVSDVSLTGKNQSIQHVKLINGKSWSVWG
ncbi:RCC1 and BTB domain-containing protein 1-like [Oppia nitens]|uniref:RCC1 and BTB domain-containing protein 1-like n=1 Tax=Oppia nitens TaxID=1686743 RepID=UPI0023DB6D13|nr:RCC1 and BTB domain-containing protein 1-like [Oppia nitens]